MRILNDVAGGSDAILPQRPRLVADPPHGDGSARRWLMTLLYVTVFLLFGAVVWYAYTETLGATGEPPLVKAQPGPYKRSADTPGGIDVENERSNVVSVFGEHREAARIEKILPREAQAPRTLAEADPTLAAPPPPEEPVVSGTAGAGGTAPDPSSTSSTPHARTTADPLPATSPPASAMAARQDPPVRPEQAARVEPPARAEAAEPVRAAPSPARTASPGDVAKLESAPEPRLERGPPTATTASPRSETATTAREPAPANEPPTGLTRERQQQTAAVGTAATRPAAPPSAAANTAAPAPWAIQLAAVSSPDAAERAWVRLRARHPDLLGSLELRLVPVQTSTGTLHRMQAGGFADRDAAARVCANLRAANTDCFIVATR